MLYFACYMNEGVSSVSYIDFYITNIHQESYACLEIQTDISSVWLSVQNTLYLKFTE
jgi:hypothetical protein